MTINTEPQRWFVNSSKTIMVDSEYSYLHQKMFYRFAVDRQVKHKRVASVGVDSYMRERDPSGEAKNHLRQFVKDIDTYYSMPAI